MELLGGHFYGETGLPDEAKLGGETDRSACGAGQGEEKYLVLQSAGCRSGVQLIPVVGPERRPRSGGAEVTGSAHDVPLLQHEELVVGERGEVAALVSTSVRADDTFEASGREEEVLEMHLGVGIPGGVASLGSSAAHLRPAVVEQAGLLVLHGWELRVRTGSAIPRCGHHNSGTGGGVAGAFDQLGEEQGVGLALVGLTGETKPDLVDAAHDLFASSTPSVTRA